MRQMSLAYPLFPRLRRASNLEMVQRQTYVANVAADHIRNPSRRPIGLHIIDTPNNHTPPLYPITEMKKRKLIVDYDEDKMCFNDDPTKWYKLPTQKKGLLLIPMTKEACEKFPLEEICNNVE